MLLRALIFSLLGLTIAFVPYHYPPPHNPTTPAAFTRSNVVKLPLVTLSHSPLVGGVVSEENVAAVLPRRAAATAATAAALLTPLAAQADTIDENTVVALGIGLVSCVVSLAVGFTIGYGTLTKP